MTDYLNIRCDAAFLSLMGTLILILIISIKDGGINLVLREFPIFILGGVRKITIDHSTFLSMFTVILATVSISLICSMGAGILSNLILGDSHSHLIEKMLNNLKEGNFFFSLFVLVVAEELFARWFFLGVLTRISFLSSTFMFYILFLIGNGIWSLIHLHNFEEDRHIL